MKSAERLVDPTADKNPGVAVIEPEQPDPRAESGQPSAEVGVAVEDKPKISPNDGSIRRERFVDASERAWSQRAVGMEEEQHVATSGLSADREARAATGARDECPRPAIACHLERPVPAAAIHNDDLVGGRLLTNGIKQSRKRALFVEGRDDDRDHL